MNYFTEEIVDEIYFESADFIDYIPDQIDDYETLFRVVKSYGKINSYNLIFNLEIDSNFYNTFIRSMKRYNEKLLDLFIYYNYLKRGDDRYKDMKVINTYHMIYYYGMSPIIDKNIENRTISDIDDYTETYMNISTFSLGAFESNNIEKLKKYYPPNYFTNDEKYPLYLINKELYHQYFGSSIPLQRTKFEYESDNDFEIESNIFNFVFKEENIYLIMAIKLDAKVYFEMFIKKFPDIKKNIMKYKEFCQKLDKYYRDFLI